MYVFICGIASSCRSIEHVQPPNPLTSTPTSIYQRVYGKHDTYICMCIYLIYLTYVSRTNL